MARDKRELAYHWRVEVSKAFRILDPLWQEPVPTWNGNFTSRYVREAAHLCQQVVAMLGSDPDLIEEYAQELFSAEHEGENWSTAPWNLHRVYRDRARSELQGMAPPGAGQYSLMLTPQNRLPLYSKVWVEPSEPGSFLGTITEVNDPDQGDFEYYVVNDKTKRGSFWPRECLRPVRAQQHEQQEELHEHEQCKSVLDHPDIEVEE